MFTCTYCGHSDMAHTNWVGRCVHGAMKPKDGLDCDCPWFDFQPTPPATDRPADGRDGGPSDG